MWGDIFEIEWQQSCEALAGTVQYSSSVEKKLPAQENHNATFETKVLDKSTSVKSNNDTKHH